MQAVAPIARERGVPVIAFSTDRSVAGNGVYLLSFQPENEVKRDRRLCRRAGAFQFRGAGAAERLWRSRRRRLPRRCAAGVRPDRRISSASIRRAGDVVDAGRRHRRRAIPMRCWWRRAASLLRGIAPTLALTVSTATR